MTIMGGKEFKGNPGTINLMRLAPWSRAEQIMFRGSFPVANLATYHAFWKWQLYKGFWHLMENKPLQW